MRILLIGDRDSDSLQITLRLLTASGEEAAVHTPGPGGRGGRHGVCGAFGLDREPARVRAAVEAMRPDVVHVVGAEGRVAPSLAAAARGCGVRTLWSVTDFAPICPAGVCRTPSGNVCEECIHGSPQVMVRRCMEGRPLGNFMALVGSLYWDARRLSRVADHIAVESEFMRSKWLEAGFPASGVTAVPQPVDAAGEVEEGRDDCYCYRGPLTPESGVETLVRAALEAGVELTVEGTTEPSVRLQELAAKSDAITLLTVSSGDASRLKEAKAAVVPAESYLAGIGQAKRALMAGTPVIAAAIASLPEMVGAADGVTFTSGSAEELAAVLRDFDKRHAFSHQAIARRARERYSEDTYYKNLMKLYRDC